jgi:4a-hydroxytetrahydrobiopterin dehydratase
MSPLAALHCQPISAQPPMLDEEVQTQLAQLAGWRLVNGAIQKQFDFADFHHTMAFVNALAWIAHREDHHPDLQVSYGHCAVRYSTHSVGGISINDFICAAQLDALSP